MYNDYAEYYKELHLQQGNAEQNEEDEKAWILARDAVATVINANKHIIFETDATYLDAVYLSGFEDDVRNVFDCRCCLDFIRQVGKLVTIDPKTGRRHSLLPQRDACPLLLRRAFEKVKHVAEQAKILGLFVHYKNQTIGHAQTGKYHHFHCTFEHTSYDQTRWVDFDMVDRFLHKYECEKLKEHVECAKDWLKSGKFVRAVALEPHIQFLDKLLITLDVGSADPRLRTNLLWHSIAKASPAFCHWSQTLPGKLIEAIDQKEPFEQVVNTINEQMGGLVYQRPQAPPSAGNEARANKLIENLDLDLRRRMLLLEEVPERLWPTPKPKALPPAYDLQQQEPPKRVLLDRFAFPRAFHPIDPPHLSWLEFKQELADAEKMFYFLGSTRDAFGGLVTSVDPNANRLLHWDVLPEEGGPPTRNPVSWFFNKHEGTHPSDYGLTLNKWVEIAAIAHLPHMWNGGEEKFTQFPRGVILILEGACQLSNPGLCLFPEFLRPELREVRATIESRSKNARMEATISDRRTACGIILQDNGKNWDVQICLQTKFRTTVYVLDRWGRPTGSSSSQ